MKKIKNMKILQILLVFIIILGLSTSAYAIETNNQNYIQDPSQGQNQNQMDQTIEGGQGDINDGSSNLNNDMPTQNDNFLDNSVSNENDGLSNNSFDNFENDFEDNREITSATIESVNSGLSDEGLSITDLLLIVSISLNIVLLILSIVILLKLSKKI